MSEGERNKFKKYIVPHLIIYQEYEVKWGCGPHIKLCEIVPEGQHLCV